MLRFLIRGYLLRRLLGGGRRHHRGGWMAPRRRSVWMAPRHRRGHYVTRPRARTNVRVGGCCLPVPLGVFGALLAGGHAVRRGRR